MSAIHLSNEQKNDKIIYICNCVNFENINHKVNQEALIHLLLTMNNTCN